MTDPADAGRNSNPLKVGTIHMNASGTCHEHEGGQKQRTTERCCVVGCIVVGVFVETIGDPLRAKKVLPTPADSTAFAGRVGDVETPPPRYG